MANYSYWKIRSEVESQRDMTEARSALHEGKDKFFKADIPGAKALFEDGLGRLDRLVVKYPDLILEEELVEDVLKSLLMWQYVLRLDGEEMPENFPLKPIWDASPDQRDELDAAFQQKVNSSSM